MLKFISRPPDHPRWHSGSPGRFIVRIWQPGDRICAALSVGKCVTMSRDILLTLANIHFCFMLRWDFKDFFIPLFIKRTGVLSQDLVKSRSARFGFRLFQWFWNLTGSSTTVLSRCLLNFRAIWLLQYPISRLRDFMRFGTKTSYRLVNRGMVAEICMRHLPSWIQFGIADNLPWLRHQMETYFRVTSPLWGECTCHGWIPLTKASDAELWCFLWSSPEQTVD